MSDAERLRLLAYGAKRAEVAIGECMCHLRELIFESKGAITPDAIMDMLEWEQKKHKSNSGFFQESASAKVSCPQCGSEVEK